MEQLFLVKIKSDQGFSQGTIREILLSTMEMDTESIVVSNETPRPESVDARLIADSVEKGLVDAGRSIRDGLEAVGMDLRRGIQGAGGVPIHERITEGRKV
jgi:hypothetical protein